MVGGIRAVGHLGLMSLVLDGMLRAEPTEAAEPFGPPKPTWRDLQRGREMHEREQLKAWQGRQTREAARRRKRLALKPETGAEP